MRILLIMDPGIPVPPVFYGGIERIVYLLAEEYHRSGHEVVLLAGPGSYCSGKTIVFGGNNSKRRASEKSGEVWFVWRYLWRNRNGFDLIHNFGRLIYLAPVLNKPVKKIMSYQRPVTTKGIKIINFLPNRNLLFTACSNYCTSTGNVAGNWKSVYNCLDFKRYDLNENLSEDAPLMFLGRLDKIKGVHTAIQVAKSTGLKLWIGGNIPDTEDNYSYYKMAIEKQIDNRQIIYLGELNDEQKNYYLGRARALLFPIEWDEPFGIVMIEAMACGTPVIANRRGSVPEVVEGPTGFITTSLQDMIDAVAEVGKLDRKACRARSVERFDVSFIAAQYLDSFASL